jgi:hypothetical protein
MLGEVPASFISTAELEMQTAPAVAAATGGIDGVSPGGRPACPLGTGIGCRPPRVGLMSGAKARYGNDASLRRGQEST